MTGPARRTVAAGAGGRSSALAAADAGASSSTLAAAGARGSTATLAASGARGSSATLAAAGAGRSTAALAVAGAAGGEVPRSPPGAEAGIRGVLPAPAGVAVVGGLAVASIVALLLGAALATVATVAALAASAWLLASLLDLGLTRRAHAAAPLVWRRHLPAALAVGVARPLAGTLENPGRVAWRYALFDHVDPHFETSGLPHVGRLAAAGAVDLAYEVRPLRRGTARLAPAELRLRGRLGLVELRVSAGAAEALRVYPNFAAVARYAWLEGNLRLAEIGIKTFVRRGSGTDFKQLADYRPDDPVRAVDWKATLRHGKPIVREYQDERDQRVVFLLDCGRRMRADEAPAAPGASGPVSHFDAALDALMLLAYVALRQGDEVGAMTFGGDEQSERVVAPRKGLASLNGLIAGLHDLEPQATQPDFRAAATAFMRVQGRRCLVVVLTNFREEDAGELGDALRLLRTRHLVLLASLRERALREIAEQALTTERDAVEVAGAHLFAQARDDAFARLAGRDAMLLDVEPQGLAVALVNRYRAVKRAGLL